VKQGLGFSPAVKVSYDFTPAISGGFEYYADYGRPGAFDRLHEQQQQIFAVTDLNVSPKWEINFGAGLGPTVATDQGQKVWSLPVRFHMRLIEGNVQQGEFSQERSRSGSLPHYGNREIAVTPQTGTRKGGFVERSSCQSKRQFFWHGGHHTAMAICACGGHAADSGRSGSGR
jgi:hypothetical protein